MSRVAGPEGRVGRERRDGDPVLRDPVQLDEIVARPLGDREHMCRAARRPRNDRLEDQPLPPDHHRRIALEREVLHRQHRRARQARRHRVEEVRQLRLQPPEQPGQRPRHPKLLQRGAELDRPHPLRHEVGPSGHCDEVEVARQRPKQLPHVRLVAGAPPPEDVRVDRDHAAASR